MFTGPNAEFTFRFIALIIAVWGVVWKLQSGLKSDLKENFNKAIADVRITHEKSSKESREDISSINKNLTQMTIQINTIVEGMVRELQSRVQRLESGQDEWTKTLRQRTHELGNEQNAMRLEIELIKREKK